MLTLVLSDNFVGLLVGWGLVGLGVVLPDRLLVRAPDRRRRGAQGLRHQRRRRRRHHVRDLRRSWPTSHSIGFGDVFSAAARSSSGAAVRDLRRALHRRRGEIGAGSAAHLASRRDGRPDAGLGADPRGDDGHRRRLSHRALRAAVERQRATRSVLVGYDRRDHGAARRDPRHARSGTSSAFWPTRRCRRSAT